MSKEPQISSERKTMYYVGGAMMLAGGLLFMSNFVIIPMQMGTMSFDSNPLSGMMFRALGGMGLLIAGSFVRSVGARGTAGSGLVLDPKQAREDLKPWAQTAGGLMKDALAEVRTAAPASPEAEPVVKVRCPQCKTLNDEDAKYCKSCAGSL